MSTRVHVGGFAISLERTLSSSTPQAKGRESFRVASPV